MYFWSEPEFAVKTALMVKIWMIFFKSGKNSVAVSRSSKGFGTADSDVHPLRISGPARFKENYLSVQPNLSLSTVSFSRV